MPISNDTAPLAQFLAGQAVRAQEFLGSHPTVRGGQSGWLFRVSGGSIIRSPFSSRS